MRLSKKSLLCALFASLLLMLILVVQGVSQEVAVPNNKTAEINKSIENGIYYLYANQLPSGRFPVYISYYPDMSFRVGKYIVLDTALIIHTLNLIDNENSSILANEMKNNAVSFLLANKMPNEIWSFWGPGNTPDTDDTALAFAALVESGVNMSNASLDYMLNYTTPEGVFYLWMTPKGGSKIDAGVNANVVYGYSARNISQTGAIQYVNLYSQANRFINGTTWYTSYAYAYLVTRDYSDGNVKELEPSIVNIRGHLLRTQKPDGSWGNDLDTALAAISLLNMGYEGPPLEKAIDYLLSTQRQDGSWNISVFYYCICAPSSPTGATYYGSEELTTSFSLEALIKYRNSINKTINKTITDKNGFVYQIQSDGLYKITADTNVHYLGFGLSGTYNGTPRAKLSTDFGWTYSEPVWNGDGYNITGRTSSPLVMDNAWITRFMFTSEQTKFGNIIKNPYPYDINNSKFYYIVSLNEGDEIVYDGVSYTVTPDIKAHVSGNLNGKNPNLKINNTLLFDYTDLLTSGFNITDVYIANATRIGFNSPLKVGAIGFTKGDGILKSGQSITIDPVIKKV